MNEKSLTVLEQFDLHVKETYRTKGNYGCVTDKGRYLLQEYNNSEGRANAQNKIGVYLEQQEIYNDYPIQNKEEKYISISVDGYAYILKKWFLARECDITSKEDTIASMRALGKFHRATKDTRALWNDECSLHNMDNAIQIYERHNKELIKVRNYIKKRKNKSAFEYTLQNSIDDYYVQCAEALEQLKLSDYISLHQQALEKKSICYGNFNHHSILFENEKVAMIHMKKIGFGLPLYDFYGYLRKIMEKNAWNVQLAESMIEAYEEYVPLSAEEMRILLCLFRYPEKFWKIVNFYFNSNKAWSSEKNEEKLKQFQFQEGLRQHFIAELSKKSE